MEPHKTMTAEEYLAANIKGWHEVCWRIDGAGNVGVRFLGTDPEETIAEIKRETFDVFKNSRQVWIIEERGADFIVHTWHGDAAQHGAGVGPPTSYPTLRKAAARFLQMLGTGPVAPQTWPEDICIGEVTMEDGSKHGPEVLAPGEANPIDALRPPQDV